MSDSKLMYRTHQVWIKPGHRLFAYLDQACQDAKNLYNTTNFYIRQIVTAFGKNEPLQPLQQEVLDTLTSHIDVMNERRREKNRSHPFKLPTNKSPFVHYNFLDALFKVMNQFDYRGLYKTAKSLIHADVNGAANIMRKVFPNVSAKGANGIEGLDGNQTINVSTPLVLSILK